MWDVKLKLMDTDSNVVVARGKGWGKWDVEGRLMRGDGRWFDFRCWAHHATHQSSITEVYTSNLNDVFNQCHPNEF